MQKDPQLAKRVRQLRISEDYSWRAVAGQIAKEYPELDINIFDWQGFKCANQIDGMDLCSAARIYFGEEIEDGWN